MKDEGFTTHTTLFSKKLKLIYSFPDYHKIESDQLLLEYLIYCSYYYNTYNYNYNTNTNTSTYTKKESVKSYQNLRQIPASKNDFQ